MQFMIKKLSPSPTDRLSVATFSTTATKLIRLLKVNDKSGGKILDCVSNVKTDQRCTNITEVLKVLDGRKIKEGRSVGIMLMSNSEQTNSNVEVRHVPVMYTFDFKAMANVLNGIATKSDGGTFSDVQKIEHMRGAFAKCLDRLQTIAAQDLKLVISPQFKTIRENVFAGDSKQTTVDSAVTHNFGNLFDKVMQKVIIDLNKEVSSQALKIIYKNMNKFLIVQARNSLEGIDIDGLNNFIEPLKAELQQFLISLQLPKSYKKLEDAKSSIVEARNSLEGFNIDGPNNFVQTLKTELQQNLISLQLLESYKKLEDAKKWIVEARNSLEDVRFDGPNNFIETLKAELQQNLTYLQLLESYKKLEDANRSIVKVQNSREDIKIDGPNNFIEMLKAEVQQFLISLQLLKSYEKFEDAKKTIVEARNSLEGIEINGPNKFIEMLKAELQKQIESFEKGEQVATAQEDIKEEALVDSDCGSATPSY